MSALLDQNHLGVLFLDRVTRAPVVRMPVYAEASVRMSVAPPPVSGEGLRGDLFQSGALGLMMRQAIAAALADGAFDALTSDQRRDLARAIEKRLANEFPDITSLDSAGQQKAVSQVVPEAVGDLGLPSRSEPLEQRLWSFPLGFLCTDHVGYASFDLQRLQQPPMYARVASYEVELNVYPMGTEGERLEALSQKRLTDTSVFAKFEIDTPAFTPDLEILNLPSMQDPGLADWYLSPGSFSTLPDFTVGADGCEALVPSQLALEEFTLSQVVRLRDVPQGVFLPAGMRFGYLDAYHVSWHGLGHSLGEISYSLPLAPGESVKLSMIDWSWTSDTTRSEDTKVTEDLLHETHRERAITETMNASLEEWQHGSSTMGGAALSAGGAASSGAYSGAVGASGAVGSTTSSTSGSRDLAAQNVQNLSDTFAQKSSSVRELMSTVVVQTTQSQQETIETRTFTNYNHSHTLTILYYQILRHFRVETEWSRRRPIVLIEPPALSFATADLDALVDENAPLLKAVLLDPSLAPAFDAFEKLQLSRTNYALNSIAAGPVARPFSSGDFVFTLFELLIKTSDGLKDKSSDKVVGYVRKFDGTAIELDYTYEGPHVPASKLEVDLNSGDVFDETNWVNLFVKPVSPVRWRDIAGFELEKWGDDEWRIDRIGLNAYNENLQIVLIPFDTDVDLYFSDNEPSSNSITFIKRPDPDAPTPGPVPTVEQTLTAAETRLLARLKNHLQEQAPHYARALRMNRDPSAIADDFEATTWDAGSSVLDHAEPYPLEVFGKYVAYPLVDDDAVPDRDPDVGPVEKLISFPVRGVFAEGKLGHCNVSEQIDETRFWRWEEHPIPVQAPDIAAATPITPTPTPVDATPTSLPASVVNIVNPSPAPDPTGVGAALTAITTANAFRDMSGQATLTDLLKKLDDNSVAIAQVAKSVGAPTKPTTGSGSGTTAPTGAGTSGSTPSGGTTAPKTTAPATPKTVAEVNDLASGIRRQLPPAQADPLVSDLYQNVVHTTADSGAVDAGAGDGGTTVPARPAVTTANDLQITEAGNVEFFSAQDIQDYFTTVTGQNFQGWFSSTLGGHGSWTGLSLTSDTATSDRFTAMWDAFPPLAGSDHGSGTKGTTLPEFAALLAIFIHETGGSLKLAGAEGVGGYGHPGLSYAFDSFVIQRPNEKPFTKGSYNLGNGNHTAYALFHDAKYLAAFGGLAPTLQATRDLTAWQGNLWPAGVPTGLGADTAFLQEADFYKFRGRGAIQSTGRAAYLPIVTFVRAYTGDDSAITGVKNRWETFATALLAQGIKLATDDDFGTVSSNADWDSLFSSVTIQAVAINAHNSIAGKQYLPLSAAPATLKGQTRGSVYFLATSIAGANADYANQVKQRVVDFIGTLWATPMPAMTPGTITL